MRSACGLMDKVSPSGGGDCGFESRQVCFSMLRRKIGALIQKKHWALIVNILSLLKMVQLYRARFLHLANQQGGGSGGAKPPGKFSHFSQNLIMIISKSWKNFATLQAKILLTSQKNSNQQGGGVKTSVKISRDITVIHPLKVPYSFEFLRKSNTNDFACRYCRCFHIREQTNTFYKLYSNVCPQFPTLPISFSSCYYFYLRYAFLKVVSILKNQWR